MKKIFLVTALFSSVVMFSQVGINTGSPKVTMDVTSKISLLETCSRLYGGGSSNGLGMEWISLY